jgi:cell division protein FtsB
VHESDSSSDTELTEEERRELEEIRKRKDELKREIQQLKDQIRAVTAEMEGMDNVDEK